MKIQISGFIFCLLLGSSTLTAQFAPDNLRGVVMHSVATSSPPYPWNQTLGKTVVGIMARTGTTYSTFLDGNNEIVQTGISYTYQKQSPDVGALTIWIPALAEYVTTYYTFTTPDSGNLSSTTSIGTIRGNFKLYQTWNWQDRENFRNQATEAQNVIIKNNPWLLGLYNQAQLDAASAQAKVGLYTQAQLDAASAQAKIGLYTLAQLEQAELKAKEGLFTQVQLDAAIDAASKPDIFFKSNETWVLADKEKPLFMVNITRSSDLVNWQTAGQAEIQFSDDALPAFIKIQIEQPNP